MADSIPPTQAEVDADAVDSAADAQGQEQRQTPADDRGPDRGVDLLPLIQVTTPAQEARESPIGGYVRFYVCDPSQCGEAVPTERSDRRYVDEHRDWLARWLIGRSVSRIVTLKLTVARPSFSTTVTLASSVLQSSRTAGENWASEVNGRRFLTPFFRVDPNTMIGIDVAIKAANEVQANISQAVSEVASRAVALIRPEAQLVTSLNSDRLRQTSTFIDETVSTLFAQNLAERTLNEFGPENWGGKPMVDVAVSFPMRRTFLQPQQYMNVGVWRVMATRARVSIFSEVPMHPLAGETVAPGCTQSGADGQACSAFTALPPQDVFDLQVSGERTLGAVLFGETGISSELSRLQGSDTTVQALAGRRLCTLLATKARELGLNRYDAAAVVWAFAQLAEIDQVRRDRILDRTTSCWAAGLAATVGLH